MHTISQLVDEITSGNSTENVYLALNNAENDAPYASLVHILRAMNEEDPELRFKAAIYSPDRGRLKHLVNASPLLEEATEPPTPTAVEVVIPQKKPALDFSQVLKTENVAVEPDPPISKLKNRPVAMWKITPLSILADTNPTRETGDDWKLSIPSSEANAEISTPLNDYIQEQTALVREKSSEITSSVHAESKRQEVDLVSKFLAKPSQTLRKTAPGGSEIKIVDAKATESLHTDENLATETLAKLHLRQNHQEEAIKIYEQLSLRYPEKSRYFAKQIQKIKEKEL